MENEIVAPRDGVVQRARRGAGGAGSTSGQLLCVVAEPASRRVTLADLVELLVGDGTLTGATLSRPRAAGPGRAATHHRRAGDSSAPASRWRVRRHYGTRTTDENLDAARARAASRAVDRRGLPPGAPPRPRRRLAGARGTAASPRILRRPPTRPSATGAHDRAKRHLLPEGEPVPFLVELGVQTAGRPRARASGGRSSGR